MNCMERLAKNIGVNLYEEFTVKGFDCVYRFTENGLEISRDG